MEKIIHQILISDSSNAFIPNNYQNIKEIFHGYKHIVWTYEKIKKFIIEGGDMEVIKAIENIKPNAFKADIARYYILYKIGGWYSDINNFFIKKIDESDHNLIIFKDSFIETKTSWSVSNGLFFVEKNSKIMKSAIEQCVENVKNKYYGGHALCPTGPNLFGSSIAKYNLSEDDKYLIGTFSNDKNSSGFFIDDILFCKYKTNSLTSGQSGIPGGNNYVNMWWNREVYNDN